MSWGLTAVTVIAAVATIGGTVMKMQASKASETAQESAVKSQSLQNQLKLTKQKNQEMQQVHIQLANNQAKAGMRGLSVSSPSFNAIQMDTFNKTADALQAGTAAIQMDKFNTQSQLASVHAISSANRSSMWWQETGSIAQLGMSAYSMGHMSGSAPRGQGSVAASHASHSADYDNSWLNHQASMYGGGYE
jgi:hypothetical protein